MKQAVAPLQANEVNILRRKLTSFDVSIMYACTCIYLHVQYMYCILYVSCFVFQQVKQHEFREVFRGSAPFAFDSENEYARIDKVETYCTQLRTCT